MTVSGVGMALAGVHGLADMTRDASPGAVSVDPAARLGKKGLRYKDRATTLALVAADEALRTAGLLSGSGRESVLGVDAGDVAVIVSSNLGNIDSVCTTVELIAQEGSTRLLSPITTPNLSSNVIASEIAIRFGARGPNLMLCSGATSGIDALLWAQALLGAGRAAHVVVVGVEPDTEPVRRLHGSAGVLDGAAAVVIEAAGTAEVRGVATMAQLLSGVRADSQVECLSTLSSTQEASCWFGAELDEVGDAETTHIGRRRTLASFGIASGALGVLQSLAAVALLSDGHEAVHIVAGNPAESYAGLTLLRAVA